MRNPQDTKNLLILNQLVKRHFSLAPRSEKLFKYRTLYDPNKALEYLEIIGDAPDLRRRFKIKSEDLQRIDEGWDLFKNIFHSYMGHSNLEYKNFISGKITVQKNEIKLFKAIFNYYKKHVGILYSLFNQNNISDKIQKLIEKYLINKYGLKKRMNMYITFMYKSNETLSMDITYSTKEQETDDINTSWGEFPYQNGIEISCDELFTKEEFEDLLRNVLTKQFERIGSMTLPKKDLELVISYNPADMFMASTGESWSSCINMNSDYEELYWSGIPGTIVDKNRAIVYITDGKKKSYEGIIVDKFVVRSWLLTLRNKIDNKNYIQVVAEYPIIVNLHEILNNLITGYNFIDENNELEKPISRYYFEGIFFKTNDSKIEIFNYIYLDSTGICLSKKNKGKLFPNEYFYHRKGGGNHYNYGVNITTGEFHNSIGYYFSDCEQSTLTFLIDNNRELAVTLTNSYSHQENFDEDYEENEPSFEEVLNSYVTNVINDNLETNIIAPIIQWNDDTIPVWDYYATTGNA